MKKFFLFIAMCYFATSLPGQITLEHTYDSTATFTTCGAMGQLMIVDFEISGQQYVGVNRCGEAIKVYDLNHQLRKTISLANIPKNTEGYYESFLYFSETLFDSDSGMEFMHIIMRDTVLRTYVFNEDGSQLFFAYGAPLVWVNFHLQQYPVYNTAAGMRMILSFMNGDAKVYKLNDPTGNPTNVEDAKPGNGNIKIAAPRPNPNNGGCVVEYALPPGTSEGEIIFYDIDGRLVKRFKVGSAFTSLFVSTADLSPGTYYYQLVTGANNSNSRKMIVVE